MKKLIFIPELVKSGLELNGVSLQDISGFIGNNDMEGLKEALHKLSVYDRDYLFTFFNMVKTVCNTPNPMYEVLMDDSNKQVLLLNNKVPKSINPRFVKTPIVLFVVLDEATVNSFVSGTQRFISSVGDTVFENFYTFAGEVVKEEECYKQYLTSVIRTV